MSYEEELYRRLTTGQSGSESRYLDKLSNMGADTPAERDFLKKVMTGNVDANTPRVRDMVNNMGLAERGVDTPAERDFLRNAMATGTPQATQTPAPTADMGNMTPAELDAYYKSFADEGINLNPMGGLIGAAQNVDKAITNATTAPGILGDTQLRNIGMGNSNVSPYGLGLGQPMYINPNQYGLLNF
jgi:hypothetical protein